MADPKPLGLIAWAVARQDAMLASLHDGGQTAPPRRRLIRRPYLPPTPPSAEEIAEAVAAKLRPHLAPVTPAPAPSALTTPEPEWLTARQADALGLLSRRAFIDAASAGKFPARRGPNGGGAFVAKREDVEHYVSTLSVTPTPKPARASKPKPATPRDELDAAIEAELAQGLYVVQGGKK